jgi:hypothetical protein
VEVSGDGTWGEKEERREVGGGIYTWETILNGIIVRLRVFDILTNNGFRHNC